MINVIEIANIYLTKPVSPPKGDQSRTTQHIPLLEIIANSDWRLGLDMLNLIASKRVHAEISHRLQLAMVASNG